MISTDEWIQRAKRKHGDRYDYSKSVYKNARSKVTITCREHGDFEKVASQHLTGYGCLKCSGRYVPTTDEWIQRAKRKHGDRYDYSKSVYKNANSKLTITCREHGDFEQRAAGHVNGENCPKCRCMSTSFFIYHAKRKHGDRYDYSKSVYRGSQSKVTITCREHGDFEQTPVRHHIGHGCSKCSGRYVPTTDEWIQRAKRKHGDRYDYSKSVYKNANSKLTITCREHGDFEQSAVGHIKHGVCPECKHELDADTWIRRAKLKHGDRYDYGKSVYRRSQSKVTITCREHGDFEQTPNNHLTRCGCPECMTGGGFQEDRAGYVYVLVSDCGSKMKIGVTCDVARRLSELSSETPFEFTLLDAFKMSGEDCVMTEKFAHLVSESLNLKGFSGATEWFRFDSDVVNMLRYL